MITKDIVIGWISTPGSTEFKYTKAELIIQDTERDIAVLIVPTVLHFEVSSLALSVSTRKILENDSLLCYGFRSSSNASTVQVRKHTIRLMEKSGGLSLSVIEVKNSSLEGKSPSLEDLKGGPVCFQQSLVGVILGKGLSEDSHYILPCSSFLDVIIERLNN